MNWKLRTREKRHGKTAKIGKINKFGLGKRRRQAILELVHLHKLSLGIKQGVLVIIVEI